MAQRQSYIVVPNAIITESGHSASKRLLVAMLSCSMPSYHKRKSIYSVSKSYDQLKEISGIDSDTTLSAAIRHLIANGGLLHRTNHYAYSQTRHRMERQRNSYTLDRAYIQHLCATSGYTLVPRSLLDADLTNAQFAIALLLYKLAGSKGVARPSIRAIAAMLRLALSTVVLALRALRKANLFVRILRRYIGRRGGVGYRINRYCVTDSPFAHARKHHGLARIIRIVEPVNGQTFFSDDIGVSKNGVQELLTS